MGLNLKDIAKAVVEPIGLSSGKKDRKVDWGKKEASGNLSQTAKTIKETDTTTRVMGFTPIEDKGGDSLYVSFRDQIKDRDLDDLERKLAYANNQGLTADNPKWQPMLRALTDEINDKKAAVAPAPAPTPAQEAKTTSKEVSTELKEQGAKSKEELKALGVKASQGLKDVNTAYQDQMAKIGGEAGKKSAEAYGKQTAALDKMGGYADKIKELTEKGAADSPFVQRQIKAYNAEVDAAAEGAKADLSRKMAARGFSGSNEQIYLEGKLDQDIARSKATGAVDIESRYVQFQVGVLEFQSQLAFSEAQFFGNQFQAFSGIQIGIETTAAQAGAELGTKAVGIETGLTQAGIQSEEEFAKASAGAEVGGAQFAAQMAASGDALKESMRQFEKTFQFETEVKFPTMKEFQQMGLDLQKQAIKSQEEIAFWNALFGLAGTGAGTAVALA